MYKLEESSINEIKNYTFSGYLLSIDIGATKTLIRLSDYSFETISEEEFSTNVLTDKNNEEKFVPNLKDLIEKKIRYLKNVKIISISTAGAVNSLGEVIYSPNLGWKNYPLKKLSEKIFNKPVEVINDCNAGALAEKYMTPEVSNLMYITISSGIGAGLILKDELFEGENYSAAELGHLIIKPYGEKCSCGRRGCVQAYASGRSLAREYRKEFKSHSSLPEKELIIKAMELYRKGDRKVIEITKDAFSYLGEAIAYISGLLDISNFRLGGGILKQSDVVVPIIQEWADEFSYKIANRKIIVKKAYSFPNSSIMGAEVIGKIRLYWRKYHENKNEL
ncbi:MAG: hypothetical protein PWQ77_429 [Kosmotogales bacterium]|nr:hypothetical protein [Kosmotogales bacterium]